VAREHRRDESAFALERRGVETGATAHGVRGRGARHRAGECSGGGGVPMPISTTTRQSTHGRRARRRVGDRLKRCVDVLLAQCGPFEHVHRARPHLDAADAPGGSRLDRAKAVDDRFATALARFQP
jgi:hypothetical protein